MDLRVLCVLKEDRIANIIKERIQDYDTEVLIANNGDEAISILNASPVHIAFIGSIYSGLEQQEFVEKLIRDYKDLVLNVCTESSESAYISKLANKEQVWKVHIQPFSLDKQVEGILTSKDRLCIEMDTKKRIDNIQASEKKLETILVRLRESLMRHRYSYNVIEPFFNGILKECGKSSDLDKKDIEFLNKAAAKMLLLQTTTTIKTDNIIEVIQENLSEFDLGNIESALDGDVVKKTLGDIVFDLWACAYWESINNGNVAINISSENMSTTKVVFEIKVTGDLETNENDILLSLLKLNTINTEVIKEEGIRRYILSFEVEYII